MGWGLETNSAAANFEHWTLVAHRLSSRPAIRVVSLYNRSLLIDEQLLAALRGHPAILTAKGTVANPHWLPAAYRPVGISGTGTASGGGPVRTFSTAMRSRLHPCPASAGSKPLLLR